MDDIDILRQAQLLLGQYGFEAEQEGVAKAIRIISATARRLGVAPKDCVVYEDTDLGIEAARRAGMIAAPVVPSKLAGECAWSTA